MLVIISIDDFCMGVKNASHNLPAKLNNKSQLGHKIVVFSQMVSNEVLAAAGAV